MLARAAVIQMPDWVWKSASIVSHSHGWQAGALVSPHMGLSTGVPECSQDMAADIPSKGVIQKRTWLKLQYLLWLSLRSHVTSLPQYLIDHTGEPYSVWEGTTQGREYQEERTIGSYLGIWLLYHVNNTLYIYKVEYPKKGILDWTRII